MSHDINSKDLALESIELARTIDDETLRKQSMASIYGLVEKYLEDIHINNFREVLKMSKFFEEITKEISEKKYLQGLNQGKLVIAKNLLLNGSSVDFVIKNTDLDEETVKALKDELIH